MTDAQQSTGKGDSAGWKKNFVRAMNHLAYKSASAPAAASQGCPSEVAGSVALSHVTKMTVSAQRKADEAAARVASLAGAAPDAHWECSTKARDDAAKLEVLETNQQVSELMMENPDLKQVHSAASVKALLVKRAAQQ